MSQEELLVLIYKKDERAFTHLYDMYSKSLFSVINVLIKNREEAEDVLQEAFLDAFNRIKDFRQETTFGLWLKQIVINRSINYLRKRKMDLVSLEEVEVADEPNYDESETHFKVEAIKAAMAELPDGYRVVLTLYLFEGYVHEEIAHILKKKENTINYLLIK